MKQLYTYLILFFVAFAPPVMADEVFDWREIDRVGTLADKNTRLVRNLWDDYSQAEAVALVKKIPNITSARAYTELAKTFLLTQDRQSQENIDAPLLLAARLNKLIGLGLTDEATALSEAVTHPDNYDLAVVEIQQKLLNDSLASVCLDIQAASALYRDMPAWRELVDFCRLRYGGGEKINMGDIKFTKNPTLKNILSAPDSLKMSDFKDNITTLIAFNDNLISEDAYNNQAQDLKDVSNLAMTLAIKESFKGEETYQCYAIESAKRGLIDSAQLSDIYMAHPFSDEQLANTAGRIQMHPCDIPAYFYQRLNADGDQESTDSFIDIAMQVGKNIPATAFAPFSDVLSEYKGDNAVTKWRAAIILGANNTTIPQDWTTASPLITLQNFESIDEKDYIEWLNAQNDGFLQGAGLNDKALILYLSQVISSNKPNFGIKTKIFDYENLFSLTYAKKSLHLGLGFNDYIAGHYNNDQHADVITSMLSVAKHADIRQYSPNDIGVILSGLKAYKLEKNAITHVFEYLQ